MSVQAAVYAVLNGIAPTWPGVAPEDAPRPRLTYSRIAGSDIPTYDGDGSGAGNRHFQVDAWADSAGDARRLSDTVRAALYAARIVGGITDNPDDYEKDTKLYLASFTVEVWE